VRDLVLVVALTVTLATTTHAQGPIVVNAQLVDTVLEDGDIVVLVLRAVLPRALVQVVQIVLLVLTLLLVRAVRTVLQVITTLTGADLDATAVVQVDIRVLGGEVANRVQVEPILVGDGATAGIVRLVRDLQAVAALSVPKVAIRGPDGARVLTAQLESTIRIREDLTVLLALPDASLDVGGAIVLVVLLEGIDMVLDVAPVLLDGTRVVLGKVLVVYVLLVSTQA
jgi:hypothetical protein